MFNPWTWCMKNPFGYRITHHGYLLTSCPGQSVYLTINKLKSLVLNRKNNLI